MSTIKEKESFFAKIPKWNTCLNIKNKSILNSFLDGFMGVNKNHSLKERLKLVVGLSKSLSLDILEKKKVIDYYQILSRQQLEALFDVFINEEQKFLAFEKESSEDIKRLVYSQILQWFLLLNPENGDFIFLDKVLKLDKLDLGSEALRIIIKSIFDILTKEERYVCIFYIADQLKSKLDNVDCDFFVEIINNLFYSGVKCGRISLNSTDYLNEINNIIDSRSDLDKKSIIFVQLCLRDYIVNKDGVKDLNGYLRGFFSQYKQLKGRNNDLLRHLSQVYLQYGDDRDFDKAIKSALKSATYYYAEGKKFSKEILGSYFSDNSRNIRQNTIHLIIILYISNHSVYQEKAVELAQICYELLSKISTTKVGDYTTEISIIETIIDTHNISNVIIGSLPLKLTTLDKLLFHFHHSYTLTSESLRLFFLELFNVNSRQVVFIYGLRLCLLIKLINRRASSLSAVKYNFLNKYQQMHMKKNIENYQQELIIFQKFLSNEDLVAVQQDNVLSLYRGENND